MMTSLSYAAQEGRAGLVVLLLKRGDVDVYSKDFCETTPLAHAAISKTNSGCHQSTVVHSRVDPDVRKISFGLYDLSLSLPATLMEEGFFINFKPDT